jgi:hypothetical protein
MNSTINLVCYIYALNHNFYFPSVSSSSFRILNTEFSPKQKIRGRRGENPTREWGPSDQRRKKKTIITRLYKYNRNYCTININIHTKHTRTHKNKKQKASNNNNEDQPYKQQQSTTSIFKIVTIQYE